jgi:hypothetical protein
MQVVNASVYRLANKVIQTWQQTRPCARTSCSQGRPQAENAMPWKNAEKPMELRA